MGVDLDFLRAAAVQASAGGGLQGSSGTAGWTQSPLPEPESCRLE